MFLLPDTAVVNGQRLQVAAGLLLRRPIVSMMVALHGRPECDRWS